MADDPLLRVLDQAHVDAVRGTCVDVGLRLDQTAAIALAIELDRAPDPNAEAELLIARRFLGVRGLVAEPDWRPRRVLPARVAKWLGSRGGSGRR